MKKMRNLILGSAVFISLLINLGVMALNSEPEASRAPQYHWYKENCVAGGTYKICYATGDLEVCSPWGSTDPNPKCPDAE